MQRPTIYRICAVVRVAAVRGLCDARTAPERGPRARSVVNDDMYIKDGNASISKYNST